LKQIFFKKHFLLNSKTKIRLYQFIETAASQSCAINSLKPFEQRQFLKKFNLPSSITRVSLTLKILPAAKSNDNREISDFTDRYRQVRKSDAR